MACVILHINGEKYIKNIRMGKMWKVEEKAKMKEKSRKSWLKRRRGRRSPRSHPKDATDVSQTLWPFMRSGDMKNLLTS